MTANLIVYYEAIKVIGDEIFYLENEVLKDKLCEVNEKWLSKFKKRIKLSYDDEKKFRFIFEWMKRQTQKLKAI